MDKLKEQTDKLRKKFITKLVMDKMLDGEMSYVYVHMVVDGVHMVVDGRGVVGRVSVSINNRRGSMYDYDLPGYRQARPDDPHPYKLIVQHTADGYTRKGVSVIERSDVMDGPDKFQVAVLRTIHRMLFSDSPMCGSPLK